MCVHTATDIAKLLQYMYCAFTTLQCIYAIYCIHYLLVPTDLTLTTDRLTELFQSVKDPGNIRGLLGSSSIGELLGLPQSALLEIKSSYQSWAKRKEAYLDTYIHRHPCPSWKKISEVLERCRLHQQAREVKRTYVRGMRIHYWPVHCRSGYISVERG